MKVFLLGEYEHSKETKDLANAQGWACAWRNDIAWLPYCDVVISHDFPVAEEDKLIVEQAWALGIPVYGRTEDYGENERTPYIRLLNDLDSGRRVGRPIQHLCEVQFRVREWVAKQPFADVQTPGDLLHGLVEEVGELNRAHLKERQGIRGNAAEHRAKAKDAVGDILIFLMGYCSMRGWAIEDCLKLALDEVLTRDWNLYPETGHPPVDLAWGRDVVEQSGVVANVK